jgi:hypothetical protein
MVVQLAGMLTYDFTEHEHSLWLLCRHISAAVTNSTAISAMRSEASNTVQLGSQYAKVKPMEV